MVIKKYKLSDVAKVEISSVDKKTKDCETPVKLCNFTDVYHNWAITTEMADNFMKATANAKEIEKFTIRKGQVAFTKDSETRDDIGIPTYIADDFENVLLGYHCALITPDESKISGKYLNAFMHSAYIQKYFELNATGSGMRYTLSLETLQSMPLLLPSLEEQEAIGNLFSSIDRKIALNRSISQNLEALAKQLYDYWFVQFDFPNKEGRPYKSNGGKMVWNEKLKREIPDGWEAVSVNDISDSYRGVSYAKDDLVDEQHGLLVLRGNNIQNSQLVFDSNVAYIPESFVSDEQKIRKGHIIMTMSSGSKEHVGKCVLFHHEPNETYGAFLTKFVPHAFCSNLLYNVFNSDYFKSIIKSTASGTGINNLTNQTFDNIFIAMPPMELLQKYDALQDQLFGEVGNLQQNTWNLIKQRDELLPLLMNSQVTLE